MLLANPSNAKAASVADGHCGHCSAMSLPLAETMPRLEPFCGSAAVSIAAAARGRAKEFWLNDFNQPQLRRHPG